MKLNTDGVAHGTPDITGCSGIIRDHIGQWQYGFMANIGMGNALEAKASGLCHGLNLAWCQGYRRVLVELDSKVLIGLLQQ